MTRSEQEKLVERYLSGEMNSSQEEEFFIQVAVDNDLRQTLKAYRVVESAIRKHRETVAPNHAESRARLLALLSAGAASPSHAGPNAPSSGGSVSQPAVGHLTMSASALRWIIGSVAVVGLTLGALIVAPMMQKKISIPPAANTPASGVSTPKGEAPHVVEPPASASEIETGLTPPVHLSEDSPSIDHPASPAASRSLRDHSGNRAGSPAIAARTRIRLRNQTAPPTDGAASPQEDAPPEVLDRRKGHIPVMNRPAKIRLQVDSVNRAPSRTEPK